MYVHWGYIVCILVILNYITRTGCGYPYIHHNNLNSQLPAPAHPIVFHYIVNVSAVRKPKDFECAICLNSITSRECSQIRCKHIYHTKCIDNWIKTCVEKNTLITCPQCRSLLPYSIKEVRYGEPNNVPNNEPNNEPSDQPNSAISSI